MKEIIDDIVQKKYCGTIVDSGEMAYNSAQINSIMDMALKKNWMVLGGDAYTNSGKFDYATWHYEPTTCISLEINVIASIEACKKFVEKCEALKPNCLYVLIMSDEYVSGIGVK